MDMLVPQAAAITCFGIMQPPHSNSDLCICAVEWMADLLGRSTRIAREISKVT